MKHILEKCINGETLSASEAEDIMKKIMEGKVPDSQIASLITILRFRGETVEEMTGFVKAMKENMTQLEGFENAVDTCGTGGDGASTFNISTASAIVASSLGVKVAKHGNRAVSSRSGSADVLECLNIPIQTTPEEARRSLEETNMSFLFAPLYHSSMKHVAKARKEVGFRTIFNLLGPLANPANTKRQVLGVSSLEHAEKMAETLKHFRSEHVLLVSGRDGLDEISISDETDVVELKDGNITKYTISPEQFGMNRGKLEEIQVSDAKESAKMIEEVLKNKGNESVKNIVALNSAAALYVAGKAKNISEGVQMVLTAIKDGTAYQQLKRLAIRKEESYA
ncbi:anthranilate phosphoribosyltransferase [Aeribacillus pallidus]|uniref:anthranilate phosphoribosyltransferase n=1 Tax=Aeribacillus pallidus TaxID=33936 RepID=UPI0007B48622|nr:anthranilate phosphoribosyltransferase [Aeribacillus pallidus]KZM52695.1 anthranilate phosphoribosyltransferase [Aeribacillus pallidus]